MATSLEDLLTTVTATDMKARLLALLQAKGYPTTDWVSGSIDRTLIEVFSDAMADQTVLIPDITSGGYNELASGEWLSLNSEQLYLNTRNPASFTVGDMLLTCAATAGPYVIAAGQLRAVFSATGNIYSNVNGGALPSGGTLELEWQSESPNNSGEGLNYIDASNATVTLQTSLAGVTITNPAPDFSPVTLSGNSTGTFTLSRINVLVAPTPSSVVVRIEANGDIGVATFSYQVDGGSFQGPFTVTATYDITALNIRLTFANGGGTPNSFLVNDLFAFVSPGSWITSQGTDEEADEALRARNRGRWPSLSLSPTEDLYATYARVASPSVIQVRVAPSTLRAGGVSIIIRGQAGALDPTTVSVVQDYVNQRAPLNDRPLVQSATTLAVTIDGTCRVKLAFLEAAQTAQQTNVARAIFDAGIGGTLYLAQIIEEMMNPDGVVDFSDVLINGVAANLVFGTTQVGTFNQVLSSTIVYITV